MRPLKVAGRLSLITVEHERGCIKSVLLIVDDLFIGLSITTNFTFNSNGCDLRLIIVQFVETNSSAKESDELH